MPNSTKQTKTPMITPQQLRIGNWVHHDASWSYRQERKSNDFKEFDFEWDLDDFMAIAESTMDLKSIDPIPLTESWLLKFGFESIEYITQHKAWGIEGLSIISINGKFRAQVTMTETSTVHQLQNLYFALTGHELQIKNI